MVSKRDRFIAAMKAHLDELSAELHRLEAKAGQAEAGARRKYRQATAELHQQRLAAEAKLEELHHAGEEKWPELREESEKIWTAFKAGLDALRDFSDHA
jgi:DnaJ-domain-containing protein 1